MTHYTGGRNRLAEPTYGAIHRRLGRDIGPAKTFQCVGCGSPAQEWSYNGGSANELIGLSGASLVAYSVDLADYSPRCRKCHRGMDRSCIRARDERGRWAPG
jgi:hypothetical protein